MPRVYSKEGCFTCRRRRKKCDEGKPVCGPCLRLEIQCSYAILAEQGQEVNTNTLPSPIGVVKALRTFTAANETESMVIARAPQATLSFYLPTCVPAHRDLRLVWQMLWQNLPVRNAIVACFSAVLGNTAQSGQLNRVAYGAALRQIADLIRSPVLVEDSRAVLRTSIHFLGLLDILSSDSTDDPTRHWRALAHFLPLEPNACSSILEVSAYIPALEAFMYGTSCLALFTADVHSICKLWNDTQIVRFMEIINPEDSDRMARSPLLGGEYMMYELVLTATDLHRRKNNATIDRSAIDALHTALASQTTVIEARFISAKTSELNAPYEQALRKMYEMLILAVRICFIALDEESESNMETIDRLVMELLTHLVNFPATLIIKVCMVWPIQILACGIRQPGDFATFKTEIAKVKILLDPGHQVRLDKLIHKVELLREDQAQYYPPNAFPRGLSLLQKPGGILS